MLRRALATASTALLLAVGSQLPADAIASGSNLCNSANSEENVTVWGKGYGVSAHRVAVLRGQCTKVQPGDEDSVIVEVHGNQFRVGYDGKPYQDWQQMPTTSKRFHPANKAQIYFQLDWR